MIDHNILMKDAYSYLNKVCYTFNKWRGEMGEGQRGRGRGVRERKMKRIEKRGEQVVALCLPLLK